jgi:predicted signal transduction protein with EAL and GGDEF domain
MIELIGSPIPHAGQRLQSGCSIGIALHPGSVDTSEELVKQTDQAMYAAKQSGRGNFHYYDETLGLKAAQRLSLEIRLREAVANGHFVLHYQPVMIDGGRPRLAGFEALVRWHDGERLVPPDEFIAVAEETGLIVPLGRWVLDEACRQMRSWQEHFALGPEVGISVNVSARQIVEADSALTGSGLSPAALVLEITESLYMGVEPAIIETLAALHARRTLCGGRFWHRLFVDGLPHPTATQPRENRS